MTTGPWAAAVNDKGRVTRVRVTARILEVEADPESHDEMEPLLCCLDLMDAEAAAGRAAKAAQGELDNQVLARYDALTEAEIKALVVDNKWFASITSVVDEDVQSVMRQLVSRVRELHVRYAEPLPDIQRNLDDYAMKVHRHLQRVAISTTTAIAFP